MNGLPLFFLCVRMNLLLTSRIFPDSLDECFTILLHLELTDAADETEGIKGGWLHLVNSCRLLSERTMYGG